MSTSKEYDQEKYIATDQYVATDKESSDVASEHLRQELQEGLYRKEELLDPNHDETLQRGLSARQISMIAVGDAICSHPHISRVLIKRVL